MLAGDGLVDIDRGVKGAGQGHILDDWNIVFLRHLADFQGQIVDALGQTDRRAVALIRAIYDSAAAGGEKTDVEQP